MRPRQRCQNCNRILVAFKNHWLHPEKPCNGITDSIYIEATIEDEFLHKKFIEMYGKPEMDDSDMVTLLEVESDRLYEALKATRKKLDNINSNWLLRFLIKKFKR